MLNLWIFDKNICIFTDMPWTVVRSISSKPNFRIPCCNPMRKLQTLRRGVSQRRNSGWGMASGDPTGGAVPSGSVQQLHENEIPAHRPRGRLRYLYEGLPARQAVRQITSGCCLVGRAEMRNLYKSRSGQIGSL